MVCANETAAIEEQLFYGGLTEMLGNAQGLISESAPSPQVESFELQPCFTAEEAYRLSGADSEYKRP